MNDTKSNQSVPAASASAVGASFLSIFPFLILPMFLAVVDQTIVAAALPDIARDLGDVEHMSMVVISYLVTATIAAPVYGRLGDLLGRRRMLLTGLLVLMTGASLCAIATSMNMLIVGRGLQGLGGGGLMALAHALIGERVAPRERAHYQGYIAAIAVCSTSLGPVAGGLLSGHFGWRSIFVVSVPVSLLALLLARRLPASSETGESFRFDVVGLLLFALMVVSALFAMRQIQDTGFAVTPGVLGLFLLSGLALRSLIWWESRTALPLLSIRLLRDPAVWRSDVMAACHGAMLVSLLTFLPIYYSGVRGRSAFETGLLLLPMTIGLGTGTLVTGRLMARTGRSALFASWGTPLAVSTLMGVAILAPRLSELQLSLVFAVNALFMGTVMGMVQLTVQIAAGKDMLGAGAASVMFSRTIGAAIGTALVSAVLFSELALSDAGSNAIAIVLERGSEVLQSIPFEQRHAAQAEVASAFRPAFITIAAFGVLSTLMVWTLPLRRI